MRRFPFGLHIPVNDLREMVVSGIAHPMPEWSPETSRQFRLARTAAAQQARLYATQEFAVAIDDVIGPSEVAVLETEFLESLEVYKLLLRPRLEIVLKHNTARTGKDFDTAALELAIHRLYESTDPEEYQGAGWLVLEAG